VSETLPHRRPPGGPPQGAHRLTRGKGDRRRRPMWGGCSRGRGRRVAGGREGAPRPQLGATPSGGGAPRAVAPQRAAGSGSSAPRRGRRWGMPSGASRALAGQGRGRHDSHGNYYGGGGGGGSGDGGSCGGGIVRPLGLCPRGGRAATRGRHSGRPPRDARRHLAGGRTATTGTAAAHRTLADAPRSPRRPLAAIAVADGTRRPAARGGKAAAAGSWRQQRRQRPPPFTPPTAGAKAATGVPVSPPPLPRSHQRPRGRLKSRPPPSPTVWRRGNGPPAARAASTSATAQKAARVKAHAAALPATARSVGDGRTSTAPCGVDGQGRGVAAAPTTTGSRTRKGGCSSGTDTRRNTSHGGWCRGTPAPRAGRPLHSPAPAYSPTRPPTPLLRGQANRASPHRRRLAHLAPPLGAGVAHAAAAVVAAAAHSRHG